MHTLLLPKGQAFLNHPYSTGPGFAISIGLRHWGLKHGGIRHVHVKTYIALGLHPLPTPYCLSNNDMVGLWFGVGFRKLVFGDGTLLCSSG